MGENKNKKYLGKLVGDNIEKLSKEAVGVACEILSERVKQGAEEGVKRFESAVKEGISASGKLDDNYDELKQALKTLRNKRRDRRRQLIPLARQNGTTTQSYQAWKARELQVQKQGRELGTEYEKHKKTPPFVYLWRASLSNQITQCLKQVKKLMEEESSPHFNILEKEEYRTVVSSSTALLDIERYATQRDARDEILQQLKNDQIKVVGVHGIKVVGKTTILKNLIRRVEVSQQFDDVIFIQAHQDHQPQEVLADKLEVNMSIEDINEALNCEKILVVLDGVEDRKYLEKLGIPQDFNNASSKVVVASSKLHICNWYKNNGIVTVNPLKDFEAQKMFQDIVGPDILNILGISKIARNVCRKCSRLPLLIAKIANRFKTKRDASSWRSELRKLDRQLQKINDGIEEFFADLSFCFNEMEDEQKKCLLYASLYPTDSKIYIDYLAECCAAQGFFGDIVNNSRFRDKCDDGHNAIGELINSSCLEEGGQMMYVTMNHVMRQLTLQNMSAFPPFESQRITTNEDLDKLSGANWTSLIDIGLCDLSKIKNYTKIKTLLLQKNPRLAIPESFLDGMSNLILLDLYKTGIKTFPSKLSKLQGLKVLYLNACTELSMLPEQIASLTSLIVLDIRGSKVPFIPSSIGSLINLKCLRLPYVKCGSQYNEDAKTVICKLTNLEELIIEIEDYENWSIQAKDFIEEGVSSLKSLTHFSCSFPTSDILEKFMAKWEQRKQKGETSFQIVIGSENSKPSQIFQYFDYKLSKYLKYKDERREQQNEATGVVLHEIVREVLLEVDAFELACSPNIKSLSDFGTSLDEIRGITIDQCNNFSTTVESAILIPKLELLYLRDLEKLKIVFKGPLDPECFSKLQTLVLEGCKFVKSIFNNGVIQNFSKLQKLIVRHCSAIEELIVITEDIQKDKYVHVLPALKEMELIGLPALTSICQKTLLPWSSLQLLKVYKCPTLTSLPFQKDKATKLRSIQGDPTWWIKLGNENKETYEQFKNIFAVIRD